MMELFGFYKVLMMVWLVYQNFNVSWSLNQEGLSLLKFKERVVSDPFGALLNWREEDGVLDPCSWFGVECVKGNVVILNLKNLRLGGTIAPDLQNLVHLKSIILRNNSFSGVIPEEIKELKKLEVLDLGCNKFGGALPSDLNSNPQLSIFLLDNSELTASISPEIDEMKLLSKVRRNEKQLSSSGPSSSCCGRISSWRTAGGGHIIQRRLLTTMPNLFNWFSSSPSSDSFSPSPSSLPSPSPTVSPSSLSSPSPSPSPAPSAVTSTGLTSPPSVFPSPTSRTESVNSSAKRRSTSGNSLMSNRHRFLILVLAVGCPAMLILLTIVLYFCRSKVSAVKPWATGLSGQLQKAFITGVPKLKRSELDVACEDFSNVIGSSSMGTMYKGTLSSGVEIAVTSLIVASAKNWPKNLDSQFRKKIDQLSKINHKNFVNLIGYCEEEPFTRMMVFEYAPNGTLFEHLHIKEAEHLDWGMRMRIAMGMAYCLDHMHQLKPPISHKNLNSSAVNLTEDYAAKISDFGLWTESAAATEMQINPESNVYSFGVILFEMITGKLPYLVDSLSLQDWASDYLRGQQPLRDMVDPILTSHNAEQLEKLDKVIKSCCCPDPKQRPTMREVTRVLKDITRIGTDGAVPKLSPLWWAELEIMCSEAI